MTFHAPDFSRPLLPAVDSGFVQLKQCQLAYERAGNPEHPAVLLIMGLGGQLVSWPQAFVQCLLDSGYQVLRFDNRDSGLSSKFDRHGRPNLLGLAAAQAIRKKIHVPYRLTDMAEDALGLLDALGLPHAHVVGISMGGMIAQILATKYPQRVSSLTSMMSTSGNRALPGPNLSLRLRMLRRRSRDAELALQDSVRSIRLMGSPAYPRSDEELRATLEPQIRRNVCPDGVARQLSAILASADRCQALRELALPALILHGEADPLIPVAAAYELKHLMPQARLDVVPGLGHDLPEAAMPRLAGSVVSHLQEADGLQQAA